MSAVQPIHADAIVRIIAAREGLSMLEVVDISGVHVKDVMAVLLYEQGKRLRTQPHSPCCHFNDVIWELSDG